MCNGVACAPSVYVAKRDKSHFIAATYGKPRLPFKFLQLRDGEATIQSPPLAHGTMEGRGGAGGASAGVASAGVASAGDSQEGAGSGASLDTDEHGQPHPASKILERWRHPTMPRSRQVSMHPAYH